MKWQHFSSYITTHSIDLPLNLFFFVFIHAFQWTLSEFFYNFRFSSRESQSQKKTTEKDHSFCKAVSLKKLILWTSTHLTLNTICFRNATKTLSDFTANFSANMFLFDVRKNICTPPFFDAQNCILEALWKQMSPYFCINQWEKFCSKDIVKFYLIGGRLGGDWMIPLRRLVVWPPKIIYNFSI